MALYKEGFDLMRILILDSLTKNVGGEWVRVLRYPSQSETYDNVKQLVKMYGSNKVVLRDKHLVEATVTLIDEWAVYDGIKTVYEATQTTIVTTERIGKNFFETTLTRVK